MLKASKWLFEKSKQTADSKQTAYRIKNPKLSYLTILYCICIASVSPKIQSRAKSKQTAECKQTADLIKKLKFSYLTTLYSISEVISQC